MGRYWFKPERKYLSWTEPPWPVEEATEVSAKRSAIVRCVLNMVQYESRSARVVIGENSVTYRVPDGEDERVERWGHAEIRDFEISTIVAEGHDVRVLELRRYNHTPVTLLIAPNVSLERLQEVLQQRVFNSAASA